MRRARKSRSSSGVLILLLALLGLVAGCDRGASGVADEAGAMPTLGAFRPHGATDPHAALGPDQLLQVALQHLREGRPAEAGTVLTQAIAKYPDAAGLYAVRGALRLDQKQFAAALDDLEAAVKLDPEDPVSLTNRAQAYRAFNRLPESLADLDRAIKINPDMVAARFNRGAMRYTDGNYQAALEDFNQCIRVDPGTPAPYFNRAVTWDALGDRPKAIADLRQFVKLSDNADWKQTANDLLKQWETQPGPAKPESQG